MLAALASLVIATPLLGLSVLPAPKPPASDFALDKQGREVPEAALPTSPPSQVISSPAADLDTAQSDALRASLRERNTFVDVHTGFAIATWVAMATTAVFGLIQLYDEYGFAAPQNETPCIRGGAVFGFCGHDPPVPHLAAGLTTGALFATTFILGYTIPDPFHIESSHTPEGHRARAHRVLSWITLSALVTQVALGFVLANATLEYRTAQGLAWTHFGVGLATFGLTTADALIEF
jgi:hypothetical protein